MAFFENIWTRVSLTLLIALGVMAGIYWLSWQVTSFNEFPQSFIEQGERVVEIIDEISGKITGESIGALECRLIISMESYALQKGFADNSHRLETLFANLAHTNALFLMVMFVTFVGIIFAIFQMASAYEGGRPDHGETLIEGAGVKLQTGYVSLAVSVIGIVALSIYLPNAHEVKQLESVRAAEINFDSKKYFEYCGKYIEP